MDDPLNATAANASVRGALFGTDVGQLSLDTRLVLCKLLTGPCIDPDSALWPALLRDEPFIRSRLSDVFLDLILDRERKVAFTRQADTGELDTPILLRSSPLTYIDSVLLLHLRQVLVDADMHDQRAVVEEAELVEQLEVYAAPPGADQVAATKRITAAIEKMKKNSILQGIRGAEKRYEVSPTLRLLFSADDVQALGAVYRALAVGDVQAIIGEDEGHDQG